MQIVVADQLRMDAGEPALSLRSPSLAARSPVLLRTAAAKQAPEKSEIQLKEQQAPPAEDSNQAELVAQARRLESARKHHAELKDEKLELQEKLQAMPVSNGNQPMPSASQGWLRKSQTNLEQAPTDNQRLQLLRARTEAADNTAVRGLQEDISVLQASYDRLYTKHAQTRLELELEREAAQAAEATAARLKVQLEQTCRTLVEAEAGRGKLEQQVPLPPIATVILTT